MPRSSSRSDTPAPIWHVTRGHGNATTFVSVVWAIDGPRFAAVAATEEDCLAQIARYVAEQAQGQLWPPSAGRVAALLAAGDQAGAVTEYFGRVGERWDGEWLTGWARLRPPGLAACHCPGASGRGNAVRRTP